ncbi:cell division protein ZapA [Erythrobacter sp. WG]|uniref:cell division protein ZapA n=1 Tax=Erythrobacter sp. WG TaxID=2985510 RepID=UPI0022714124|nr:cell division protein ZapA [Erythrobacter sp. WG]MCX9147867.1 cell division protein ZapA [Erythrobacter sp. WG]
MSTVTLSIGPKTYTVACADGQEAHIRALGAMIADKYAQLGQSRAPLEAQNLLFAALFMADELDQARKRVAAFAEPDTSEADALRAGIARLEAELAAAREEAAEARDAAAVAAARAAPPPPLAPITPQFDLFGGPPATATEDEDLAARLEALAAQAEASAAALEAALPSA